MSTDSRPIPREFLLWVWIISYWNFNCTYEQLQWQELSLNEIRKLFGRRISAIKNLTNNSSNIYKKRIRVTIDNWSRNKILKYVEREINILKKKTSVSFICLFSCYEIENSEWSMDRGVGKLHSRNIDPWINLGRLYRLFGEVSGPEHTIHFKFRLLSLDLFIEWIIVVGVIFFVITGNVNVISFRRLTTWSNDGEFKCCFCFQRILVGLEK